jgi:hypothetical protein
MFQVFFSIDISVMRNYDAYLFLDDGDGILALGRKDCKIYTKEDASLVEFTTEAYSSEMRLT